MKKINCDIEVHCFHLAYGFPNLCGPLFLNCNELFFPKHASRSQRCNHVYEVVNARFLHGFKGSRPSGSPWDNSRDASEEWPVRMIALAPALALSWHEMALRHSPGGVLLAVVRGAPGQVSDIGMLPCTTSHLVLVMGWGIDDICLALGE